MKIFTINKNGKPMSFKSQVWLTKNSFVVFSVSVSSLPKSFSQKNFVFCVFASDSLHIFPPLLLCQNIHNRLYIRSGIIYPQPTFPTYQSSPFAVATYVHTTQPFFQLD